MEGVEHHDRYLTLGLELIVGVGRPELERLFPKLDAFVARRCPRPRLQLPGTDLDLDIGLAEYIAIPAGVFGRAALLVDDDPTVVRFRKKRE